VRVERRPDAEPAIAQTAGPALQARIKDTIGVSIEVAVVEPDQVERSLGKMRRIIDQRPPR
jgi:phenylacetate-CoA ligase